MQGSRWENVWHGDVFVVILFFFFFFFVFFFFFFFFFFFWFVCLFVCFCDLIPHFSSFSSVFPSLFFCLFLRISYAGPFERRLIGVDVAALRKYNGKPNIFGSKI